MRINPVEKFLPFHTFANFAILGLSRHFSVYKRPSSERAMPLCVEIHIAT
jgi:hypothetical protein